MPVQVRRVGEQLLTRELLPSHDPAVLAECNQMERSFTEVNADRR